MTSGLAFVVLVAAIVVALQAVTGEIWTRGLPKVSITREANPKKFWLAIALQVIAVLVILALGGYPRLFKGE